MSQVSSADSQHNAPALATPPRPTDAQPVPCPVCESQSIPDSDQPCEMCTGRGAVVVFWASEHPLRRGTKGHFVIVGSAPAICLCGVGFAAKNVGQPGGIPCMNCITILSASTNQQRYPA